MAYLYENLACRALDPLKGDDAALPRSASGSMGCSNAWRARSHEEDHAAAADSKPGAPAAGLGRASNVRAKDAGAGAPGMLALVPCAGASQRGAGGTDSAPPELSALPSPRW